MSGLWPWVAFAANQYRFERKERRGASEPTPTEIGDMIKRIKDSAENLAHALIDLQKLSYRLDEPTAPSRRPHISYLGQLIAQAAAGMISDDVIEDDEAIWGVDFRRRSFLERVNNVRAAAQRAQLLISEKLLKRPSAQPANPSLYNLVWRAGKVWTSLTGRRPTAYRLSKRPSKGGGDDPPFVTFVIGVANMADGSTTNLEQIARVLLKQKQRRTP